MMIAGFSDSAGRRPAYIFCYTVYLAANIGLALQRDYAALLVLRCLQSAGSRYVDILGFLTFPSAFLAALFKRNDSNSKFV